MASTQAGRDGERWTDQAQPDAALTIPVTA